MAVDPSSHMRITRASLIVSLSAVYLGCPVVTVNDMYGDLVLAESIHMADG